MCLSAYVNYLCELSCLCFACYFYVQMSFVEIVSIPCNAHHLWRTILLGPLSRVRGHVSCGFVQCLFIPSGARLVKQMLP